MINFRKFRKTAKTQSILHYSNMPYYLASSNSAQSVTIGIQQSEEADS